MHTKPGDRFSITGPSGETVTVETVINCDHLPDPHYHSHDIYRHLWQRHRELHNHLPYSKAAHDEVVAALRAMQPDEPPF